MTQTIQNLQRRNMGQAAAGLCFDSSGVRDRETKTNTGLNTDQTIADVTVAGTIADGDTVTLTFTGTSAESGAFNEAVQVAAVTGDTATTLADRLVAAVNDNEFVNDVLFASNVAGVISFTVLDGRMIDTVAAADTGTTTLLPASPTITAAAQGGAINFGYLVAQYPSFKDDQCSAMTTATNLTILGIAERRYQQEASLPFNPAEQTAYRNGDLVTYIKKGKIWVPVDSGATRGSQPSYDPTTGEIQPNGVGTALPNSLFITNRTSEGLIGLSYNIV